MTESTSSTPATSGSLFENIVDVFVSPSRLFDRTRNASFVKPALVASVLSLVLVLAFRGLTAPFMDAEMQLGLQRAAAAGKPMPPEAVAAMEKFGSYSVMGAAVLGPWLSALIGGLVTLIAARIVGARLSFGQAANITAWAYFPMLLGFIANAVMGLLVDPSTVRSAADGQLGIARFFDPLAHPQAVHSLLLQFDVFNIWTYVLYALGITIVARSERSTGTLASIIRFAIMLALTAAGGMMSPG